jgi:hypothetical protein
MQAASTWGSSGHPVTKKTIPEKISLFLAKERRGK